jgi:hypothetical protein
MTPVKTVPTEIKVTERAVGRKSEDDAEDSIVNDVTNPTEIDDKKRIIMSLIELDFSSSKEEGTEGFWRAKRSKRPVDVLVSGDTTSRDELFRLIPSFIRVC